ncbi:hypothetical protein [Nakamurella deserti]|uniref:hypothetical protein n=1 Tax=Nakamurella deserti TaxID=2164074 RepID=UPI00130057B1|nr:hypothetical protein [Nakamurella deserti]
MTIIDNSARQPGTTGAGVAHTARRPPPQSTRPRPGTVGERIVLAPGLRVVERDDRTLQIGVEPPRRVLVRHPPPGAAEVFGLMAQGVPLAAAVRRTSIGRNSAADTWDRLTDALLADGFLVRTGEARPVTAAPATAPADAVAVVVGAGRVATSVAALLAAAGTGHVHLDPDRALRAGDATPAGAARTDLEAATSVLAFDPLRRRDERYSGRPRPAGPADRTALAGMLRRVAPGVAVHRPSGFVRPDIVVLATDGPPPPDLTRRLMTDGQPHLVIGAGEEHAVVGPLVLPGRSSCLHCHDLHRRDADAGWPQVQLALRRSWPVPPAVLATTAAAIATEQVLHHLTGGRPATVDGTLESRLGDWRVRRRSWRAHPSCFCRPG